MIAIIDYGAGNLHSVENALNRLGAVYCVTQDLGQIKAASKVILPGVGSAEPAMQKLNAFGLDKLIPELTQPVLGICLGLQLMCRYSAEGNVQGLGIFDTEVKEFPPLEKVPHMGWNNLTGTKGDLFKEVNQGDDFYFVHSYYAAPCVQTIAFSDYILPFSAALQNQNFWATQFHPEKSGAVGERLLKNFLQL